MKFYNSIIILLFCLIGLNLVESSPCSSDSDCNDNGKCNTTSTICTCNTGINNIYFIYYLKFK
jgi:hypothetical protein